MGNSGACTGNIQVNDTSALAKALGQPQKSKIVPGPGMSRADQSALQQLACCQTCTHPLGEGCWHSCNCCCVEGLKAAVCVQGLMRNCQPPNTPAPTGSAYNWGLATIVNGSMDVPCL